VLHGGNLSSGEHEGISFILTADSIKVHEFYAQNMVEKLSPSTELLMLSKIFVMTFKYLKVQSNLLLIRYFSQL
jgi:hypothetical protein